MLRFLDHKQLDTTGMTVLNNWSARKRGMYLHNTQKIQRKNIDIVTGILTRDPSSQEAADLRLRPHDQQDLPAISYVG